MRKLVVYELLSLDGVAQDPDEWMSDVDQEVDDDVLSAVASQDLVLLGRRTYDEWSNYWPGAKDFPLFATFINGVEKHVVTSTPLHRPWTDAVVVNAPLLDHVRELKARNGADIGVHGSISVARTLLSAGLVDEVRLTISPVLVGAGRKLFDGVDRHARLELLHYQATPSGYLLVHYQVVPGPR